MDYILQNIDLIEKFAKPRIAEMLGKQLAQSIVTQK